MQWIDQLSQNNCRKIFELYQNVLLINCYYFSLQSKAPGRILFDQACKQLSLLEIDYFGLEYQDGHGVTVRKFSIPQIYRHNIHKSMFSVQYQGIYQKQRIGSWSLPLSDISIFATLELKRWSLLLITNVYHCG